MPTSFVDVTGGMNPLQSAQALNTAADATRNQIDWANQQALRNIQSKHTNDDGSLDQFGFIHEAASAGIGPEAVKAWLGNQNDTNAAATNQSTTNMFLKTLGLDPNALRDQSKLPGQPGAGGFNSVDGEKIPVGQSIQYNNEQGAGAPVGKSTLNVDALPSTSDEVRARAASGTGGAGNTSAADEAIDTKTAQMTQRATAWGKGSPEVASIQREIGLTGSDVDGTWGPKTAAAYKKYLQSNPNAGVVQAGNQLQFKQDVGAAAFAPKSSVSTGDSTVGTQDNPAPYVAGEPHYSDTYYGLPTKNGIVPIKGSLQRPVGTTTNNQSSSNANQGSSASTSAGAFAPKPATGAKAMTSPDDNTKQPSGTDIVVTAHNQEANDGGTFTVPAPQDNSMSYTSTPDRRSVLERLADSGTGMPALQQPSSADDTNIFDYSKVVKTGNLQLKSGIDATLAKLGKAQNQSGVNELLDQAAAGVPVPVMQMKDGKPDVMAYAQEAQAYGAKVQAAKTAAAKALSDGNTTALGEILAQNKYANIEKPQANREATNFGEVQQSIAELKKLGYKGVTPSNIQMYWDTEAQLGKTIGVIKGTESFIAQLRANPNMDKDKLATQGNAQIFKLIGLEGANNEAAESVLLGSLGAPTSIRQSMAQARINGLKELPIDVVNFIRGRLSQSTPAQYANLLEDLVRAQKQYGADISTATQLGRKSPFAVEKPSGAGAFVPKSKGSATVVRKPGEKASDFIKRGGKL